MPSPKPVRSGLLLLALALVPVPAAPSPARADKTLSPYFVVDGGESGVDALPLEATSATVEVAGTIASVVVEQTYANMGTTPLNARYVFPASTRAAVHGMRLVVGERIVEARIQERKQARAAYERAKAEGKSASLLEQQRPNVFTMEVSNVLPGDVVKVELRYTELLVPTDGVYEFVYPTVVLPRYSNQPEAAAPESDRWVKSPYLRQGNAPTYAFGFRAHVTSGVPIQDVSVPSHATDVTWTGRNQARIALAPAEKEGGNRDVVLRYRLAGEKVQSGLLLQEGPGEKFFLVTVEPPERVPAADIPPREYVFIIDVSGSMHGFPLDTAKKLIQDLIGGLRPTDRFDVILFSGAHQTMSPQSVPATAENVARAVRLVDQQRGGGGTELLPALREAMGLPRAEGTSRSFIVVTDGGISQEKAMFQYIRDHLGDANVFSFGIGSSVNRYLIDGVARAGMGEAFVVTTPGEAAPVAAAFRRYIEAPVLTGIQVSFDGFQAADVEPRAIPDLLAQRPIVLQGKWTGAAAGTITVTGRTGRGRFEQVIDVGRTASRVQDDALRYLWARTRIAALSDFSAQEESEDERREITRLGLEYGLLTRHTSFVAVLQEVRNRGAQGRDVDQPLPLPQGVSDLAVGDGNAQGDEPGLLLLGILAVGFAALVLLRRARAAAAP
ncbi:MAG TPA: VIT domain-containing protein [Anaeromyxobacteraceae bacterium]|nr:VIT domain-containing protein [Anaeromyxobacteraceae bacterium]